MARHAKFRPWVTSLEQRVALSGDEPPPVSDGGADVQPLPDDGVEVGDVGGDADAVEAPASTIAAPHELAFIRVRGVYQPIGWLDLHNQLLARVRNAAPRPSTLVFGDSITHDWEEIGKRPWNSWMARLGAANLGVAGDLTQNLLWRLENGALETQPKAAILMIGLNNLSSGDSVEDTAAGVLANVEAIHRLSPRTRVLLLGILPTMDGALNAKVGAVNAILAERAGSMGARFVDLGPSLLTEGGQPKARLFADSKHLTEAAYREISSSLAPVYRQIALTAPVRPKAARVAGSHRTAWFHGGGGQAAVRQRAWASLLSTGVATVRAAGTTSTIQGSPGVEVIVPAGSPSSWTGTGSFA